MIFTKLKDKKIQKYFEKKIAKKRQNNLDGNKIKTILVVLENDLFIQQDVVKILVTNTSFKVENIDFLIYKEGLEKEANYIRYFSSKEFSWIGKITNKKLKSKVKAPYDMLVNLDNNSNIYINLVTILSAAKFKVGYANIEDRLYDLMIECKKNDLTIFTKELEKYLQILNKL